MKNLLVPIILIWFSVSQVFAQAIPDKVISIEVKNQTISEVLLKIGEVANINIGFQSNKIAKTDHKLTFKLKEKSLSTVLRKVVKGTDLTFKFNKSGVIIYEKEREFFFIEGHLSDLSKGVMLPSAQVLDLISGRGGLADKQGFYRLKLKKGNVKLRISYLGYEAKQIDFLLTKDTLISISLKPGVYLDEVVIQNDKKRNLSGHIHSFQSVNLVKGAIKTYNTPMGEGDLMRNLEGIPGVDYGVDGFGGIHVRGGNADQNLILLDGVEIYQPTHAMGVLSVFDPGIIKSAQFQKGGFNARYGEQLSSVMDVRTRDGHLKDYHSSITSSLIATRITSEGPLIRNKLSFLVSGRLSHLNQWFQKNQEKLKRENDLLGTSKYNFGDLYAKLFYKLDNQNRFYLNYFTGTDRLQDDSKVESNVNDSQYTFGSDHNYQWHNKTASLRWSHIAKSNLYSINASVFYSTFGFQHDNYNYYLVDPSYSWVNKFEEKLRIDHFVESMGFTYALDVFPNRNHHLQFGAKASYRKFHPDHLQLVTSVTSTDVNSNINTESITNAYEFEQETRQFSVYGEDRFSFGKFSGHVGVNAVLFYDDKGRDLMFQPRFLLNYRRNANWQFSFSADHTAQYLQQLSISGLSLPSDPWIPIDSETGPQEGWQFVLSTHWQPQKVIQLELGVYWKWMNELTTLTLEEGENLPVVSKDRRVADWADYISGSSAVSYGIESSLKFDFPRTKVNLNGSLAWAKQQLVNGMTRPHPRDIRHMISINLEQKLGANLSLTSSWIYRSGTPLYRQSIDQTFPIINTNTSNNNEVVWGDYGSAYHRWDIGLQYSLEKEYVNHEFNIGFYNLYNRQNSLLYVPVNVGNEENVWKRINALPRLPSISYRFSF